MLRRLVGGLTVAGTVVLGAHLVGQHPAVAEVTASAPPPAPPIAIQTPPAIQVPVSTVLATPKGTIPTYGAPGAASSGTVGTFYGYNLVLPVVAQQGDWLDVRLPQRPNESTTWIQSADVTLSSTPYRIVVDLATRHLTAYQAGLPIMHFPVGIGEPATPTVTGHYFVAVHEPHGNALYGPVILDLSAHSDAIQSFEGSGDAIIAIHGPIDSAADAAIATAGARVSNGCVRMHVADVTRLSVIPVGTPVDIEGAS